MKHEVGVATQPGPGGQSATLPWCECGWNGPLTVTRDEALVLAAEHARAEGKA